MKKSTERNNHTHLKSRCFYRRQMWLPLLVLIASTLLFWQNAGENFHSPRPLNSQCRFEDFYNPTLPYVSVNVPSLYYTGCAAYDGKRETGYYYYTLEDGICHFYLLDPSLGYPDPPERGSLTLNGRLIRLEDDTYQSLLEAMADSLSWTVESLQSRTSPYIISALPYPVQTHDIFQLLAGTAFLIALMDLSWLFFRSIRPHREPHSGAREFSRVEESHFRAGKPHSGVGESHSGIGESHSRVGDPQLPVLSHRKKKKQKQ